MTNATIEVEPHILGPIWTDDSKRPPLSAEAFEPYAELLRDAPYVYGQAEASDDVPLRLDAIRALGRPVVNRDVGVTVPDGNVVTFFVAHGLGAMPLMVMLVGGGLPIASLSYPAGSEWSSDSVTLRAVVGGMQDWTRKVVLRFVGIDVS